MLNVRHMRFKGVVTRLVAGVVAVAAVGAAGACGGKQESAGNTQKGELQIWSVRDTQSQPVVEASIAEYNKTSKVKLVLTTYATDTYKQKLRSVMTSADAPDIFMNWGGGNLAELVRDKKILELATALSKNTTAYSALMPIVLSAASVDGVPYGIPMSGMQPTVLFYNNDVFASVGAQPPKTYDDLLGLIEKFKARGVVPFALAGSQGWAEIMYLEYLVERLGGQEKLTAIEAGSAGAWRDPSVLAAARMCQDLVKRGAFGSNFATVGYDNSSAGRLLATGKAAMHLMGAWEYGSQLSANPEFARSGSLAWTPFPTVAGGPGETSEIIGTPNNFFSVRANSAHTDVAVDFLMKTMTSESYVDGLIKGGLVPAIKGVDKRMAATKNINASFATFTYQLVESTPSFSQSWDQSLTPTTATTLSKNVQKLFLSQITPEDFVNAMDQAARQ